MFSNRQKAEKHFNMPVMTKNMHTIVMFSHFDRVVCRTYVVDIFVRLEIWAVLNDQYNILKITLTLINDARLITDGLMTLCVLFTFQDLGGVLR